MQSKVKLTNNLPQLGARFRNRVEDKRVEAEEAFEADWKRRVHVITGFLRDSIHREPRGDHTGVVVADAPYAAAEEYGNAHREGHPSYTPAREEARATYPDGFKGLL